MKPIPKLTAEDVRRLLAKGAESTKELDARLREVFTLPDNDLILYSPKPSSEI